MFVARSSEIVQSKAEVYNPRRRTFRVRRGRFCADNAAAMDNSSRPQQNHNFTIGSYDEHFLFVICLRNKQSTKFTADAVGGEAQ